MRRAGSPDRGEGDRGSAVPGGPAPGGPTRCCAGGPARGAPGVMSWEPGIAAAFTAASGGRTRLATGHLESRRRLSAHHDVGYGRSPGKACEEWSGFPVFQELLPARDHRAGERHRWVRRQAVFRCGGRGAGGMVAAWVRRDAVFVVPVPALRPPQPQVHSAPTRGDLALHALNDQGMGRAEGW